MKNKHNSKERFLHLLKDFASELQSYVSDDSNQWTIKGFIDSYKNVYSISSDTKIISKIIEIHLFPKFLEFAKINNYEIIHADHQNYYPDITFVSATKNEKFAVDLKTTYILESNPEFCNGFTLGSHGAYFIDRNCSKNIQFPYNEYSGHFCLGVFYQRNRMNKMEETKIYEIDEILQIPSVIRNLSFFAAEKWTIASDKGGSGNTANIGSIKKIKDIIDGNGVFKNLGEEWFDDYWMNYGKISIQDEKGRIKRITSLDEFMKYKGLNKEILGQDIEQKERQ